MYELDKYLRRQPLHAVFSGGDKPPYCINLSGFPKLESAQDSEIRTHLNQLFREADLYGAFETLDADPTQTGYRITFGQGPREEIETIAKTLSEIYAQNAERPPVEFNETVVPLARKAASLALQKR
ncbi:MAG TPA: hypothetical protein VIN59_07135 [Alphaproteobacteria bacterium]